MIKQVGALDEVGSVVVDRQLNLTKNGIIELDIDEDIVRSTFEPVFDPDHFELLRIQLADSVYLLIDFDDLSFL